ncbi:MASE3 domain-containing protein [Haloplasma contractile]|uniref:Sensory transduction histidine kinase protein n=1 Tax=Haloplasma contractile SSD-17B TaxID=1033810 RepID=U2FGW1_9MOLU|nr:MASE3 domain-containing protein [Haloplasma contractile]ERJ12090.1 sensory transduction histidine kinase protein [Haloplasma contractile SSD-17B]
MKYKQLSLMLLIFLTLLLILFRTKNYRLFHLSIELSIMIMSIIIFMIVWRYKSLTDKSYIVLLGVAYLQIAIYTFLHSFASGQFNATENRDLAVHIWLVCNTMQSVTFLLSSLLYKTKFRLNSYITLIVYCLLTLALSYAILTYDTLPNAYQTLRGISTSIITIQFVNSIMMLTTVYIFIVKNKAELTDSYTNVMIQGIFLIIVSIWSFNLLQYLNDIFHTIGYVLTLFSHYLIFRAVITYGVFSSEQLKKEQRKSQYYTVK